MRASCKRADYQSQTQAARQESGGAAHDGLGRAQPCRALADTLARVCRIALHRNRYRCAWRNGPGRERNAYSAGYRARRFARVAPLDKQRQFVTGIDGVGEEMAQPRKEVVAGPQAIHCCVEPR